MYVYKGYDKFHKYSLNYDNFDTLVTILSKISLWSMTDSDEKFGGGSKTLTKL